MIEYKSKPLPFRGGVRYSKVDSGDHTGSPLRNPRQLVEGFSARHSRALDETSRFRATTWGRPYGGQSEMWITPDGVEPYPYGIRGTR